MAALKRMYALIAFQAVFTLLQTYLISKISLIGKIGIALFYKEYTLLRSGWKTFFLFFSIQIALIVALGVINQKYPRKILRITALSLVAVALIGFILNYLDFLHTYSHRLLKERFHLGFYLFWSGWIISCVFFLNLPRKKVLELEAVPEENKIE